MALFAKSVSDIILGQQQRRLANMQNSLYANGLMGGPMPVAAPSAKPLPQESIVTAVVGWRKWRSVMFGEGLYSMNGSFLWTPKKKAISSCAYEGTCNGLVCGCGIHAYKTRADVEASYGTANGLIGEVYLWGRVLECEKGYRAQFAYPKSFLSTSPFAETYAAEFGIKVVEP